MSPNNLVVGHRWSNQHSRLISLYLQVQRQRTGFRNWLDYFGARYYSNGLGRFVTPDWAAKATAVPYSEFSDPQSLNLYTYVRNIPTTRYDPDGHDSLLAIDIIQFLAAHFGHVGTVEGNVRSEYNARIAETKANQGEVSQHGESAMKSLTFGLVIDDTIDNHLNLAVTPDGKVDVDPGSTARDFPDGLQLHDG